MMSLGTLISPVRAETPKAALASSIDPEALWQHSRNSVGIARLLFHERRPIDLVDTACCAAMEYACRGSAVRRRTAVYRRRGTLARALGCPAGPPWRSL